MKKLGDIYTGQGEEHVNILPHIPFQILLQLMSTAFQYEQPAQDRLNVYWKKGGNKNGLCDNQCMAWVSGILTCTRLQVPHLCYLVSIDNFISDSITLVLLLPCRFAGFYVHKCTTYHNSRNCSYRFIFAKIGEWSQFKFSKIKHLKMFILLMA